MKRQKIRGKKWNEKTHRLQFENKFTNWLLFLKPQLFKNLILMFHVDEKKRFTLHLHKIWQIPNFNIEKFRHQLRPKL